MNPELAEDLLRAVMGGSEHEALPETIGILRRLGAYKYDAYQQYAPGRHFIESLAIWLDQFSDQEERFHALRFIMQRLIYVSDAEIRHLVSLMVRDRVPSILQRLLSQHLDVPFYRTAEIRGSDSFRRAKRSSLFLGMSDGARIDQFRRIDPTLSNEQFAMTYELSEERADSLLRELRKDLKDENAAFTHVFLVDDFAGSGRTIIREGQRRPVEGRLFRFLKDTLPKVGQSACPDITICLYMATTMAVSHIKTMIASYPNPPWGAERKPQLAIVMLLEDGIRLLQDQQQERREIDRHFDALLRKYYSQEIEDDHKKTVIHGYSDCALPLILPHNTPNNSLYLLWEQQNTVPLFPRVERHHAFEGGN